MGRRATGNLYRSRGAWFVSLSLRKRIHFRLESCRTETEAELRRQVLAGIAAKLKRAKKLDTAEVICRRAAEADDATVVEIVKLVDGLASGSERAVVPSLPTRLSSSTLTFKEFGERWTSNELAGRFRRRVKVIDHSENIRKLMKHVYGVEFGETSIGEVPLDQFTLDHADHVLAQPKLPEGSVRAVAQCIHRVLSLAVYPARLISSSPLPRGWLPAPNPERARTFLFPDEDAALLRNESVALVRRLFLGVLAREGPRKTTIVRLQWSDLTFGSGMSGYAEVARTKNGKPITWSLDPGTTEALWRWKKSCPSERWVFPAEALPRSRRRNHGEPMAVGNIARVLREGLEGAGVSRASLFEQSETRTRLRAHDLRATFVTLALANGKSEDWVRTRTGHSSSQMIARYRRDAETVKELGLGWLRPLHEAIPELADEADADRASGRPEKKKA